MILAGKQVINPCKRDRDFIDGLQRQAKKSDEESEASLSEDSSSELEEEHSDDNISVADNDNTPDGNVPKGKGAPEDDSGGNDNDDTPEESVPKGKGVPDDDSGGNNDNDDTPEGSVPKGNGVPDDDSGGKNDNDTPDGSVHDDEHSPWLASYNMVHCVCICEQISETGFKGGIDFNFVSRYLK